MKRSALTSAFVLAGFVLAAGPVNALSCVRPDVAQSFQSASTSEDRYVVLLGRFSFDALPPRTGTANAPDPISLPAKFEGQFLSADGFVDAPALLDVTLNFTCLGPWCGGFDQSESPMVAFVEETAQGYVLNVGPCPGAVFTDASPRDVQQLEACMRGEACEEAVRTR